MKRYTFMWHEARVNIMADNFTTAFLGLERKIDELRQNGVWLPSGLSWKLVGETECS